MVLVAVWEDGSVVLGAQVGLDTLAVGGTARKDVLSGLVTTDKGDGLDLWGVKDEVDGLVGTVDDVENSVWETGIASKLGQDHGSSWITLRWLEDQAVTGDGSDWDGPERNHGWEVERADSRNNTKWLSVGSGLHVLGDLEDLTGDLGGDTTGGLSDLKTTEDISLGVRDDLALLQGDGGSESVPILSDQLNESEHDLLASDNAGSSPCWESLLRTLDCCSELGVGALWDAGDEVVGGWVVEIDELGGLGLDKLVVNEVWRIFWVRNLLVGGWICRLVGLESRNSWLHMAGSGM